MAERQDVLYPPPPTSRTPRRSSRLSPPKRPSTTAMRVTRSQARQHPLPQRSSRVTPIQSSSLSPPPPEVHERATTNVELDNPGPAPLPFVPHIAHRYETPDHDLPPIVGMELEPLAEPRTPSRKRKVSTPPDSDSEDLADKGPLLSEYMCPICFSPPKQAIITPCGHILCGSCLHGSAAARPVAQNLCPVCRTVIPNLRFTLPDARPNPDTPLNVINRTPEDGVVDVDPSEREERWDPGRSGVIGLEILTIRNL